MGRFFIRGQATEKPATGKKLTAEFSYVQEKLSCEKARALEGFWHRRKYSIYVRSF